MERRVFSNFPSRDRERLAVRAERVRLALRHCIVRDIGPMAAIHAVNAKDRDIAMAAIRGRATIVVTNDRRVRRSQFASLRDEC